jgi:hypothetical protein
MALAAKVTNEPPAVKSKNFIKSKETELDPIINPIAEERITNDDSLHFDSAT